MMKRKLTPQERYDKEHTVRVQLKLHKEHDKDVLDYLENTGNKQGTIKRLVREELARK